MTIQRKYDFQPGTRISSSQVDEEFNNLIVFANTLEEGVNNRYTKEQTDNTYAKKTQENWIPLILQNGWGGTGVGNAEPRYMKDEFGFVHFKGSIWGGAIADWTIIANLPVGYIPSERIRIPTVNSDGGENTRASYIVFETDGTVKVKNLSWNSYLELNIAPYRV